MIRYHYIEIIKLGNQDSKTHTLVKIDISNKEILEKASIDPNIRTNDLTDENVSKIREVIEANYQVESDLRRKVSLNIKLLSEINCVRGRRHRQQLPLRGQRTRTNARSRRGSKKTVAGKKK